MFSISLMGIDFGSVLLNVLAIIGIIIAGGFVVFFLGDLLISVYDPKNSALKINKKADRNQPVQIQQAEKPQELTYGSTVKYDSVDYAKALEEERFLKAQEQPIFYSEPVKVEPKVEVIKEEPKTIPQSPEDIFAQLRAEEELFKQEKLKAATEHKNVFAEVQSKKDEEDEEDDEFNFDDIFFSEDDLEDDEEQEFTSPNETEQSQPEEEPEDEVLTQNEPLVSKEDAEELRKNEEYLAQLKEQNEQLRRQIDELVREKQTQPAPRTIETLSTEELEERLVALNERLKVNERELRSIKKEYIPLSRVRRTLESDKKKLRRKEALVAKQKILLYGVNNISDIDKEKAKKLQEDLDLLDGLRLSVQHCEEVIKNSEERYPILETSHNILTRTINEIKEDIAQIERHLAKVKK